ncbi:MAG: hypothetical protein R3B72_27655 [Polyangiaceae bacterium]
MAESDVSSNIVNGDGGGLALFAPFAIADSTIIGNTAADSVSLGAGLYIEVEDSVSIEDSYVEENWAVLRGGGLHVEGGPRSLLRST